MTLTQAQRLAKKINGLNTNATANVSRIADARSPGHPFCVVVRHAVSGLEIGWAADREQATYILSGIKRNFCSEAKAEGTVAK